MKCRRCSKAALYQEPGFNGLERCWCTRRDAWRDNGCKKHFKKGKPRRAVFHVYVTLDDAAVNGWDE